MRGCAPIILIMTGMLLAVADFVAREFDNPFTTSASPTDDDSSNFNYTNGDLTEVFANYNTVFIGSVVGFNEIRNPGLLHFLSPESNLQNTSDGGYKFPDRDYVSPSVVFEVEVVWKGVDRTQVAMPIGFMTSENRCWGRHFVRGKRYLVYAQNSGERGGQIMTSLCDPTVLFPYTFDPTRQTKYDLPDGIPDLDLQVVGEGHKPSVTTNAIRRDVPVVLLTAGWLALTGFLMLVWPSLTARFAAYRSQLAPTSRSKL